MEKFVEEGHRFNGIANANNEIQFHASKVVEIPLKALSGNAPFLQRN